MAVRDFFKEKFGSKNRSMFFAALFFNIFRYRVFILSFSYKNLFYKNHKVQKIKISLSKTFIRTLIPTFQRMSFPVKSVITIMLQERLHSEIINW